MNTSNPLVIVFASIFGVLCLILAVKDIITNKGANVAKILSKLMTSAASQQYTKVDMSASDYDVVINALMKKHEMSEEEFVTVSTAVNHVIQANYNQPECQSLALALANTIVEFTPRSALKSAYAKNADAVLAILNVFVNVVDSDPSVDG